LFDLLLLNRSHNLISWLFKNSIYFNSNSVTVFNLLKLNTFFIGVSGYSSGISLEESKYYAEKTELISNEISEEENIDNSLDKEELTIILGNFFYYWFLPSSIFFFYFFIFFSKIY
jgi:hypothetical protein